MYAIAFDRVQDSLYVTQKKTWQISFLRSRPCDRVLGFKNQCVTYAHSASNNGRILRLL